MPHILALTLILALAFWPSARAGAEATGATDVPVPNGRRLPPLAARDVSALGEAVAALLRGSNSRVTVPAPVDGTPLLVYVALREGGLRRAEAWASDESGADALRAALARARHGLPQEAGFDTVELVLGHDFRDLPVTKPARHLSNLERGLRGLEIVHGDTVERYGPTEMIAENRSFEQVLVRFAMERAMNLEDFRREVTLRRFEAEQFLVRPGSRPETVRLFRGNRVVPAAAVTRPNVAALAGRMGDWLVRQVHDDGRMTYKYWPSRGEESGGNNMIRQWMASLCLVRVARRRGSGELLRLAERNIRYNLGQFYREERDFGFIEFRDKAKLGAMALAALTIAEHPARSAFAATEAALRRTIAHLWQDDGSFRTFFKPAGRNDNQNFYPGEALVYLVRLYLESGDSAQLRRIMQSFRTYRDWHRRQRNPAFVPWHTMAFAPLWQHTGDPALKDWIFEMNDWLLAMQQTAPPRFPDVDGRFYDPERPDFGPPHASSTGVYLEGLIEAFRVARAAGDPARAETYRRAILRGLRSVMQLEFADEVDMYYVSRRARVRGALRTTVYNNEIRVDNVQHNLLALMEILETFTEDDFRAR